ncbi:MAG: DUF1214 domain-containing protein [Deltaproteobacteria bacterium]|nr:DUF1214 domain-containing protein [Deltaproteobacteria bacterium]
MPKDDESQQSVERVVSGQVWADFCDALKQAGEIVLRERSPDDPLDRAEGWRYLSRLTRLALEQSVEHADPEAPSFYQLSHETAKIGADNPDAYYQNCIIDGRHDYRLSGPRGSADYVGVGTYSGVYGIDSGIERTGFIDTNEIELDPDGRMEIVLSAKPKPGNWLPMREDTRLLIIRQFCQDRKRDAATDLQIECLNSDNKAGILTPTKIATGLDDAARFVHATASIFADWSEAFAREPNSVSERFTGLGDPNNRLWHGYWSLRDGEALVIEAVPPECEAWNFVLNNYWEESLDYRYHNVYINKHTAHVEEDGRIAIIVSPRDPGWGNWIDTVGHRHGTLCWRWTRAIDPPKPSLRIAAFEEIARR